VRGSIYDTVLAVKKTAISRDGCYLI